MPDIYTLAAAAWCILWAVGSVVCDWQIGCLPLTLAIGLDLADRWADRHGANP